MKTQREREAREIAAIIAEAADTDVDPDDLDNWRDYDIYEWLAAWDWEWDAEKGWVRLDD